MTYQDQMTLDEISANDQEMHRDLIKNAKRYYFNHPRPAVAFIGACVKSALEFLGVKNFDKVHPDLLKRIERERGIKVERRTNYQGSDMWRNGIYIYEFDHLAAFVGEPLKEANHPLLIPRQDLRYLVVTNVDPERRRRVYG